MNRPHRGGTLAILVRRSLRQHALSSGVTIFAVALACGLTLSVFTIQQQTRAAFTGGPIGFHAVLGARGSQLQLVLNTVFHLETSPGNIPWKLYQDVQTMPGVKLAIPYALGDNYRGFRIVGTSERIFSDFEYQQDRRFRIRAGGRAFDPQRMEAVVGSFAAQQTGLRVGSTFNPYHGLDFDPSSLHGESEYVVVGVMEPTNSPADRVIWIPVEGMFRMSGHAFVGSGKVVKAEAGKSIPDEHKEISAVMLTFEHPALGQSLQQTINRQGTVATLAWPIANVMADLFDKLGWVNRVLELVAYLVVAVSAGAILASIYNTINERRREFAILRAIGARRLTVFAAIVLESSAIAAVGALLGFIVYAAVLGVVAQLVRRQTGVVLDVLAWHPALVLTPLGMIAAGALVGVIPALKAYRTDVASNLVPHS